MPKQIARGNARRSQVRSKAKQVFAQQKCRFDLAIRTVGLARAKAKLTLANLAYNFCGLAWLEWRRALA